MNKGVVRLSLWLLICLSSLNHVVGPRIPRTTADHGAPDSTTETTAQHLSGYYRSTGGSQQSFVRFPQTPVQQQPAQSHVVLDPNTGRYYSSITQMPTHAQFQPLAGYPQTAPQRSTITSQAYFDPISKKYYGPPMTSTTQHLQNPASTGGSPYLLTPGQPMQLGPVMQQQGYAQPMGGYVQQSSHGQPMQTNFPMRTAAYGQPLTRFPQQTTSGQTYAIDLSEEEEDITPVISQQRMQPQQAGYKLPTQQLGRPAYQTRMPSQQLLQTIQPLPSPHGQPIIPQSVTSQAVQLTGPMPVTETTSTFAAEAACETEDSSATEDIKPQILSSEERALRAHAAFGVAYTYVFVKLSDLPPQLR